MNKFYLKNYLLDVEVIKEKNYFFIIEKLFNLNLLKLKSFYLFRKYKLSKFFFKGNFYYIFFNKIDFLLNLVIINKYLDLNFLLLNGVIYNNYYLNLNSNNLINVINKFFILNLEIYLFFFNIILNFLLFFYYFLLKIMSLIKKNVEIYRE